MHQFLWIFEVVVGKSVVVIQLLVAVQDECFCGAIPFAIVDAGGDDVLKQVISGQVGFVGFSLVMNQFFEHCLSVVLGKMCYDNGLCHVSFSGGSKNLGRAGLFLVK